MHHRRLAQFEWESDCKRSSRGSRAVNGALLGGFVGLVAGVATGLGARLLFGSDSNTPWRLGFGMFTIGLVGGAIVEAVPPEC